MSRRAWRMLLLLAALGGLAWAIGTTVADEWASSRWQARYFTRWGRGLRFALEPGPSSSVRFPVSGPYDIRLGFTRIPDFAQRLRTHGFVLARQARMSPGLVAAAGEGLFPSYHEKDQAGLTLLDCNDRPLASQRFPLRVYADFGAIPPVLVNALLFTEDRNLLDPEYPTRNPAVDWTRLTLAVGEQLVHLVSRSRDRAGGSTLATQIEKYRHSPDGRTRTPLDKLHQMESASLRAYLDGPDTLAARRRIVLDYLNTVPLAAQAGAGEIDGIGDGLWAWYGEDFAEANRLLANVSPSAGNSLERQATVLKEALSLIIAQRGPSWYLRQQGAAELDRLTDSYLRLLAGANIISPTLRDVALRIRLKRLTGVAAPVATSFVTRKALTALHTHLSDLLGVPDPYALDRFDLSAASSLNVDAQRAITQRLRSVTTPAGAQAAGLYGVNMLRHGDDPGRLAVSFTLFEMRGGTNFLRVQTDNLDQPFDLNSGARLNLGSTAKIRTLVLYLQIVVALHQRYAAMTPPQLATLELHAQDALNRWAVDYLAHASDRSERAMLEAALERRYSANPGETFFTGGGVQTFSNFEPWENHQVMTVRTAFQHSVNLVFVRLMRDIVRYEMFDANPDAAALLSNPNAPQRQAYLSRFADREGSVYLTRFYERLHGGTPQAAREYLYNEVRPVPARLATAFRSVEPQADQRAFNAFMRARLPGSTLSDETLSKLYAKYGPDRFSLADRGYIVRVHPLELWLAGYLGRHPEATLRQVLQDSHDEREQVYAWLFKTRHRAAQNSRIRSMLELEAFDEIGRAWRRLGYPFSSLTPSYATAIGASGDRPAALAELVGIVLSGGLRQPAQMLRGLDFASGTPYETRFRLGPPQPERVLPADIAELVRRSLADVVDGGTARSLKGAFVLPGGGSIAAAGKTGTGDQRFEVFGPGGRLIGSHAVNRSATFVFVLGNTLFGTITAYVHEPYAARYTFTSALAVQLLKSLAPVLVAVVRTGEQTGPFACQDHPSAGASPAAEGAFVAPGNISWRSVTPVSPG
ncbi:MAG: transglycosylase domain-containing protein [Burkholderiaceae bacterium]|nr:transglycosylase domain-containing protein [Burkholderiaceae bacterium]